MSADSLSVRCLEALLFFLFIDNLPASLIDLILMLLADNLEQSIITDNFHHDLTRLYTLNLIDGMLAKAVKMKTAYLIGSIVVYCEIGIFVQIFKARHIFSD